eukprot:12599875-Ditylum_brightwellii.AAC.1
MSYKIDDDHSKGMFDDHSTGIINDESSLDDDRIPKSAKKFHDKKAKEEKAPIVERLTVGMLSKVDGSYHEEFDNHSNAITHDESSMDTHRNVRFGDNSNSM